MHMPGRPPSCLPAHLCFPKPTAPLKDPPPPPPPLCSYLELPVSTTHSIVGAVIGMSMVAAGADSGGWVGGRALWAGVQAGTGAGTAHAPLPAALLCCEEAVLAISINHCPPGSLARPAVIWSKEKSSFPFLEGVSVIIISWFTSPLLAGLCGAGLFLFTRHAGGLPLSSRLCTRSLTPLLACDPPACDAPHEIAAERGCPC